MKELFDSVSLKCSRITTRTYSTSFSLGILCLQKELRNPIYSIYGFVRFADEIVDSFHQYNKTELLQRFNNEMQQSIKERISLNPILNSFQATVNQFHIENDLIQCFMQSMKMDLNTKAHNSNTFKDYIMGSAEVVGLMCLRVFTDGNEEQYQKLKPYAMSLGSAFQKVNFLRDLKADFEGMGRVYFPSIDPNELNEQDKSNIQLSIEKDFKHALEGIKLLPRASRFGVYVAYVYYLALFKKIKNTPSHLILKHRIRIRNRHKATLLAYSYVKHQLNLI